MLVALALSATLASSPASCESLKSLALPNTTIVAAEMVQAGPFVPQGRGPAPAPAPAAAADGRGRGRGGPGGPPAPQQMLPAHCRVNAILRPSPDSEIEMEAWFPASADGWNGKFQFVGGGGWAGIISFPAMANALQEGYATASTDTGHKGGNALFAIDHPEKVVDFAYRAVHETTVQTNAVIAGAPANYQTHLHAWDLSVAVPALKDSAAAVPTVKLAMLNKAAIDACDASDGVKDGLINNPRACKFDPSVLLCKGADSDSCLTQPQLESVK